MSKMLKALTLIVFALLLAACGGGGGGGSTTSGTPADAAKGFMEAFASLNADTMKTYLCSAQASSADALSGSFAPEGVEITIDASGLTYTVSNETADSATVTITGNLKVTTAGVAQDLPVDQVFPEFPMSKENGAWKVCPPAS